jgi:predicted nucleic-acid-binding protein
VKAVDANVVLRLLMADDEHQTALAERVFDEPVLLTATVLLETAWVLRSNYRLSRSEVAQMLAYLIDRPVVTVDAPAALRWALARSAERGDIADLMHLVTARAASAFVTFDAGVARAAGPDSPVPVETLA